MVQCITATPDALGNYWEDPAFRPIVDASLVLWLTSDFGNSGTWTDLSGLGNHGTIYGAARTPLHPLGIFGSALAFDGVDDYVDCGNFPAPSNITISAWINLAEIASGVYYYIVTKRNDDDDIRPITFDVRYQGKLGLSIRTAAGWNGYMTNNIVITTGTWYHAAVTYDGVSDPKLYVDGALKAGSWTSGSMVAIPTNDRHFYIGQYENLYPSSFIGTIGEVMINNRTLSATEIMHDYTHSPIYYIQRGLL